MPPPSLTFSKVPACNNIPVVIVQLPRKGRVPNPEFDRVWTKEEDSLLLKVLQDSNTNNSSNKTNNNNDNGMNGNGNHHFHQDHWKKMGNNPKNNNKFTSINTINATIDNGIDWYYLAQRLKRYVPDCINRATLLRIFHENQVYEGQRKDAETPTETQKKDVDERRYQSGLNNEAGIKYNNSSQHKLNNSNDIYDDVNTKSSDRDRNKHSNANTNTNVSHENLRISESVPSPVEVRFVSHALTSSSVELNGDGDTETSTQTMDNLSEIRTFSEYEGRKTGINDPTLEISSSPQSQSGHLLSRNISHSSSIHSMNSSVYRSLLLPDPDFLEQDGLSLSALNDALDEVEAPSFYMGYNSNIGSVGFYGENRYGDNVDNYRSRAETSSNGTVTSGEREG